MPLTLATEPQLLQLGFEPRELQTALVTLSNVWFSPPTGPSHHETAISILAASGVPGLSKPIHYAVWLHPLPNGHCLVPHLGYHLRRLGGGSHGVQHPSPSAFSPSPAVYGRTVAPKTFDSRGRWPAIAGITLVTLPLVSVGAPPHGLLLLLLVLRSLGAGIQTPAVNALIPQLVPPDDRMQYNGYFASLQGVAQFAAPAVAGLLMTWFPLGAALMADILTALLGMGLFRLGLAPRREGQQTTERIHHDRETLSHQGIRPVLAVYGCFIALTVPSGYLAQLLAARVYGDHYGILTAVELAGFFRHVPGRPGHGSLFGAHRLLAHPGWVSGALWRAVGCDGLGGALSPVSLLDGGFRC